MEPDAKTIAPLSAVYSVMSANRVLPWSTNGECARRTRPAGLSPSIAATALPSSPRRAPPRRDPRPARDATAVGLETDSPEAGAGAEKCEMDAAIAAAFHVSAHGRRPVLVVSDGQKREVLRQQVRALVRVHIGDIGHIVPGTFEE